jgi:hypothetical protein
MKDPKRSELFNMLEEGADSYETKDVDPNTFEIKITVPAKFKNIWLVKLDELETSLEEVEYWNTED